MFNQDCLYGIKSSLNQLNLIILSSDRSISDAGEGSDVDIWVSSLSFVSNAAGRRRQSRKNTAREKPRKIARSTFLGISCCSAFTFAMIKILWEVGGVGGRECWKKSLQYNRFGAFFGINATDFGI